MRRLPELSTCIRLAGLRPYQLPLRQPWRFAAYRLDKRCGWLIQLQDSAGRQAWGEAAPLPEIGTESLQQCHTWLHAALSGLRGQEPAKTLARLPAAEKSPPAARCGLETALLDLLAQQAGIPLAHWLAAETALSVELNAAAGYIADIGHDDLRVWQGRGYRCLKLKLQPSEPMPQALRLHNLCRELPAGVRLRLDANRAWNLEQAKVFFHLIEALPVEWVEEPLRQFDPLQLAMLRRLGPVPPALDEGLEPGRLDEIFIHRSVAALVLKPMRLGGLIPSLAIARRAMAAGLATPVTTSLDGAVATHACLHLAAALDGLGKPCAHGLATGALLMRDIASSPRIENAQMHLPTDPGLGCHPFPMETRHDSVQF